MTTTNNLARSSESMDCTVRALAVTTGKTYQAAYNALAAYGRKPRHGTSMAVLHRAAAALGFTMLPLDRDAYKAKTINTAARDPVLQRGPYILSVKDHVAGMTDGKVIDYAAGRRYRLLMIYRVLRNATAAPTTPIVEQFQLI